MGTALLQGPLWGTKSEDWAAIQEPTLAPAYRAVFDLLTLAPPLRMLDVGCGAGLSTRMAAERGASVTGLDASEGLIAVARRLAPEIEYTVGEMEALPFEDQSFDIVTSFNAFQYAENIGNTLREARRVLRPGARVAMLVWGRPEECQHAETLKAAGSCLPPPPPGAPGPFALSGEGIMESLMRDANFTMHSAGAVDCPFVYRDADVAWRGLSSAGPFIRAIAHAGEERVREAAARSLDPYQLPDGSFRQENKFRYVIATK